MCLFFFNWGVQWYRKLSKLFNSFHIKSYCLNKVWKDIVYFDAIKFCYLFSHLHFFNREKNKNKRLVVDWLPIMVTMLIFSLVLSLLSLEVISQLLTAYLLQRLGSYITRGVQTFGISAPHWKKSCIRPHIKYRDM